MFVIEIVDGVAEVRKGRPPGGFVSACTDVARLYGLRSGQIKCSGRGAAARLKFSKDIPERARQPFRNVWTPPSPPSGGGRRARG